MATFAPANVTFSAGSGGPFGPERASITTPATPNAPVTLSKDPNGDESSPNTPTRHSFAGIVGQRPLPDSPLMAAKKGHGSQEPETQARSGAVKGGTSSPSGEESQDVDMGNGDDEDIAGDDDDDASGNESTTSDTQRPSKKKKGQRFFCTDFPPCQLSFTRSEHLARHIRKHTGERPFQCHCSRRFSRLDNLRQHAQTVHVNEEIPCDSLAAQSTRFQRQIRTDRVRPAGTRSRASTIGSQGGHSRGHSRNLSTSSIASTASSMSLSEDTRRRPQPLAMANDGSARARMSLDSSGNLGASPGPQYAYYNPSSSGYSTPTSTTFSTGNASPQFQPAIVSPPSTLARSSVYNGNGHARRLSVPSTQNPFHNTTYPPPYFNAIAPASTSTLSPTSQVFASPTSSVFSHSRRDSETEIDLRRRTWHPSTNPLYSQRPATSGLTYHQTPDEPRPAFSHQPAASQMTRLPGIESFDHGPPSAARPQSSPMMVDATPRPTSSGRPSDAGSQQGLTKLDIATANARNDDQWQTAQQGQPGPVMYHNHPPPGTGVQYVQPQHISMPEQPVTPRKNKRNAWYGGPVGPAPVAHNSHAVTAAAAIRTSPEDSGSSDGISTPSTSHLTEFHPVIVNHHGGMHEAYQPVNVMPDEQKAYYNNNNNTTNAANAAAAPNNFNPPHEIPRKAVPTRSDSGFHGVPPPPAAPSSYVQQQQQPPTPTQQMYALQAGHEPRFAHANHHRHHHRPSSSSDMAKLDVLVAVAASQHRAVEHGP